MYKDLKSMEDVAMAECLRKAQVVPRDTRDKVGAERFHAFTPSQSATLRYSAYDPKRSVEENEYNMKMKMWVWNVTEFFEPHDEMDGISDSSVQFHYVNPNLMYSLYYAYQNCVLAKNNALLRGFHHDHRSGVSGIIAPAATTSPHTTTITTPSFSTQTVEFHHHQVQESCETCRTLTSVIIVFIILILIFWTRKGQNLRDKLYLALKNQIKIQNQIKVKDNVKNKNGRHSSLTCAVVMGVLITVFVWFVARKFHQAPLGSCKPNSYVSAPIEKLWFENVGSIQNDRELFCRFDRSFEKEEEEEQTDSFMICGQGTQIKIEPLVSVLRDPRFPCKDDSAQMLASKTWINVQVPPRDPGGFSYLFDLGASQYRHGIGGSSLDWLVETFASRSVRFDRIFAWEAKPVVQKDLYEEMPISVTDVISYFNVPVSSDPSSKFNPLRLIRDLTRPKDFVVLKLDIDNSPIENALVQQILHDSSLSSRIDVMFFEHHYDSPALMNGYGWARSGIGQTMAKSYNLFFKLRSLGILAHSWV